MTQTQRCTARAKSTGERCKQPAMPGATVCFYHGGAARQTRGKALQRVAEAEAYEALQREERQIEPVTNPLEALQELAGEVLALRSVLRERVGRLRANEWRYEGAGGEQLRAEVALYERALDRGGRLLTDLARLNIDERLVRVHEGTGRLVADGLNWLFDELALTPGQRSMVPELVPLLMRALGEGRVPRRGERAGRSPSRPAPYREGRSVERGSERAALPPPGDGGDDPLAGLR